MGFFLGDDGAAPEGIVVGVALRGHPIFDFFFRLDLVKAWRLSVSTAR